MAGGGIALDAREDLLGQLGERLLLALGVGLPRGLVPDLEPVHRPDDHHVLGEVGPLPQLRRDGDPTLLVGRLVGGCGGEISQRPEESVATVQVVATSTEPPRKTSLDKFQQVLTSLTKFEQV